VLVPLWVFVTPGLWMQHPARLGLFARVVCRACAHRVASGTLRKKPGPPVRGPAVLAITVLRGPHWLPKAPVPPARHTTAQRWVGCPLPARSLLMHAMLAEAFTFASSSVIGYDCVCVCFAGHVGPSGRVCGVLHGTCEWQQQCRQPSLAGHVWSRLLLQSGPAV
jgi:hypothetical protein